MRGEERAGGAEDMAGIVQRAARAVATEVEGAFEHPWFPGGLQFIDLAVGEERVFGEAEFIPLRRHHVDRIVQHDAGELCSGFGHDDPRSRLAALQNREGSDVIVMRVRHQDRIRTVERHTFVVGERLESLARRVHSGVENDTGAVEIDQVTVGPDFRSGQKRFKIHAGSPAIGGRGRSNRRSAKTLPAINPHPQDLQAETAAVGKRFARSLGRNRLQIGAGDLVGRVVGQLVRPRRDTGPLAGGAVNFRPPVPMLRQAFALPGRPIDQHLGPAFVAVLDGFRAPGMSLTYQLRPMLGVQHLVGPVEVLERRRERDAGLPTPTSHS